MTTRGGWHRVAGGVKDCRYESDGLHAIEVAFRRAINPAAFCPDALPCRVLLAHRPHPVTAAIPAALATTSATTEVSRSLEAGIHLLEKAAHELVLLDERDLSEHPRCVDELAELVARKQVGVIAAVRHQADGPFDYRRGPLVLDGWVPAECTREHLLPLIQLTAPEQIYSRFRDELEMLPLLRRFTAELPSISTRISQAMASGNSSEVLDLIIALAAQSVGCGFDLVAELASQLEKRLQAGHSLEAVGGDLQTLANACLLCSPD